MTQPDLIPLNDLLLLIGQKELTIMQLRQRIAVLEQQLKDAAGVKGESQ